MTVLAHLQGSWLGSDREPGLHHVSQDQREFIDTFGERVLPELEVTRP